MSDPDPPIMNNEQDASLEELAAQEVRRAIEAVHGGNHADDDEDGQAAGQQQPAAEHVAIVPVLEFMSRDNATLRQENAHAHAELARLQTENASLQNELQEQALRLRVAFPEPELLLQEMEHLMAQLEIDPVFEARRLQLRAIVNDEMRQFSEVRRRKEVIRKRRDALHFQHPDYSRLHAEHNQLMEEMQATNRRVQQANDNFQRHMGRR